MIRAVLSDALTAATDGAWWLLERPWLVAAGLAVWTGTAWLVAVVLGRIIARAEEGS